MPDNARRREVDARMVAAILLSVAAIVYAIAVVVVANAAPDKGFMAFTGRRVVEVVPGGPADRAGVMPGDIVAGIDGKAVLSTADYIDRMLRRSPGETVHLTLHRPGADAPVETMIELEHADVPWPAIAATGLAALLLVFGLIARFGRPGDVAARRFWRTTVIYALLYTGALSWPQLLVHPFMLAVFCVTLFLAAPVSADFAMVFPVAPKRPMRFVRLLMYIPPLLLLIGVGIAVWSTVTDYRDGLATDRGLTWTVRCIAGLLIFVVFNAIIGLAIQVRRSRSLKGTERGQAKWLLFGAALSAVPALVAIPISFIDLDMFLLVRYRPFVVAAAILWFACTGLAVLRIRLADVDAIIHRSAVYVLASAAAILVFLVMVLGVGWIAGMVFGGGGPAPPIIAAVTAAALFGPIRGSVTQWLDRRFFRDRLHYVKALSELSEAASRLREPPELAREVLVGSVAALRATSGAIYLPDGTPAVLRLAHAVGDGWDDAFAPAILERPAEQGIAVQIGTQDAPDGVLVFGPRLDGDLYSSEDRDLLDALSGQLSVAFDNARAFGTIAQMTRTLEAQNQEIRELRDKLEDENLYLKRRLASASDDESIIGSSKTIKELISQLERIAGSQANVLLTGESGTGKGLFARTLHASSSRADGPFIHVDCGAIPSGVFESELFGHERGAFTGAVRKRRGHFELADGGTVFLDEIGELPLELQPKLLRALQERSFLRVGGGTPVEVDVRIIAATNRNLEDMVSRGDFREDLYYRLRVVELTAPPLRQRKSDIPALVDHILPRLARRNNRRKVIITDAARDKLKGYGWPGNVRELENVLERAVVLCDDHEIRASDIGLPEAVPGIEELVAGLDIPHDADHDEVMEAIEKKRLETALRAAGGNQSSAARSLGMARTTLINKLRRYKLL